MWPGSKGGHPDPGLHNQERGQEIQGRDTLQCSIQISDLQFRSNFCKVEGP